MNTTKFNMLHHICVTAGFTKRGKAYFRINGDGVLQVIKLQYERAFSEKILSVGLFSMYGRLEPEWFTSIGCITRYDILNCYDQTERSLVFAPAIDVQVDMLRRKALSWLDSIVTQKQLITAITKLDRSWNDDLKFAPYLACGEINHAKKVVREILAQHEFAYYSRSMMGDHPSLDVLAREEQEDNDLYQLLKMIDRADPEEINNYLQSNYARNRGYAKFCMK